MASAGGIGAGLLGVLGGIAAIANKERARKQQEQLMALQILGRQPGMQIQPAAPGAVQPSPFLSRLFGPAVQSTTGAPVVDLGGTTLTAASLPTFTLDEVQDFPEFAGLPKTQASAQTLASLRRNKEAREELYAQQTIRDLRQAEQRRGERGEEREFRQFERVATTSDRARQAKEEREFRAQEGEKTRSAAMERTLAGRQPKTVSPDKAIDEIGKLRVLRLEVEQGKGSSRNAELLTMAVVLGGKADNDILRNLAISGNPNASPEAVAQAKKRLLAHIDRAIAYWQRSAPPEFQSGGPTNDPLGIR